MLAADTTSMGYKARHQTEFGAGKCRTPGGRSDGRKLFVGWPQNLPPAMFVVPSPTPRGGEIASHIVLPGALRSRFKTTQVRRSGP